MEDKNIFGKAMPQLIHDIRNPLNIIIGFSSILELEDDLSDEVRSYISSIQKSGIFIEELLANIDFFLLENIKIDYKNFSINELLNSIIDINNTILNEKRIIINKSITGNDIINSNEELTKKILNSLLQFSIKGIKSVKNKQIYIDIQVNDDNLTIIHSDTSQEIQTANDYFTTEETLEAKRGLFPIFIKRNVALLNGKISYTTGEKFKTLKNTFLIDNDSTHGFFITLPME